MPPRARDRLAAALADVKAPAALLAVSVGMVLAFLLLSYFVVIAEASDYPGIYLVNTFGFFVGSVTLAMAFYVQFGPRIDAPLMPQQPLPARAAVSLFALGSGIILTALRFLTDTTTATLFWRVVGYSILLALATGLTTTFLVRYSPDDEPPVEVPDD